MIVVMVTRQCTGPGSGEDITREPLTRCCEDVASVSKPTMIGERDEGSARDADAGARELPAAVGAFFVMQASFQPPFSPLVQIAVLALVVFAAVSFVYWNRRAAARLSKRLKAELSQREAELEEIANRDDLTQLGNRRFFYSRLREELHRSAEDKRPMALLMIDVDGLKSINDEFGHHAGDTVLANFAGLMRRCARPVDLLARLGGDEFAIIMPNSDRRGPAALASRLWQELEDSPIHRTTDTDIYLGVSIGVSGFPWKGDDPQALVHWADADLYANKSARKGISTGFFGRNGAQLASGVVDVLSAALDIRDKGTHRHSQRAAKMAVSLGRRIGLGEAEVALLANVALLHDIGKIGIGDSILCKPAALDKREWAQIRRHPELGYELLKGFDFLKEAAEVVLAHHERYDGNGYPKGLSGDEIPFGARVFAVIDAFDAMTSRRPYREACSADEALGELGRNAGTQFDRRIVKAFLKAASADITRQPDDLLTDSRVEGTNGRRRWSSAVQDSSGMRVPAASPS